MKKVLAFAALAALVAVPALAQTKPEGMAEKMKGRFEQMFSKADTDGNGEISKAEWQAESDARFMQADTDKNGSVSKEERMSMRKHWKGGEHHAAPEAPKPAQ